MNISARFIVMVLGILAGCKTPVKMGTPLPADSKMELIINGVTHSHLVNILSQNPDYFRSILSNPENKVQVIYTQIDRRKSGKPTFVDYYFNVSDSSYFYPASTVKLPVAILALQKLNELKIQGLDKNST